MNFNNDNSQSGYEFTSEQNQSITKLAQMMKWVGILFIATGAITALSGFSPFSIISILQGAVYGVIGYSLINAASSFKKIVDTEGNDIGNLMNAIKQLYTACATQLWSIVGLVVLVILAVVFGI